MPEGDSIHRQARRLHAQLSGQTILRSDFRVAALATTDLAGYQFTEIVAVGKHFLMRLATEAQPPLTLHSTIRMDGSWTILGAGKWLPKHVEPDTRALIGLEDQRTLAGISLPVLELLETCRESEVVGYLGPDLLGKFDMAVALANFEAASDEPIVQALLDQRNVSGIGNLWAIEVCFLRGAYPWKAVRDVDIEPMLLLAQKMMRFSLDKAPGMITTGNRKRGQTHWVYGRYKKPCLRCRTPIAFAEGGSGPYEREVWWCPSCQPQ